MRHNHMNPNFAPSLLYDSPRRVYNRQGEGSDIPGSIYLPASCSRCYDDVVTDSAELVDEHTRHRGMASGCGQTGRSEGHGGLGT